MKEKTIILIEEYLERRKLLEFMDINLWIGPKIEESFTEIPTSKELITTAKRHSIDGGIISHTSGFLYEARFGNEKILASDFPEGFYSGITIVPELFFDEKDGRNYLKNAIEQGTRLARMFPKSGNFDFRPWNAGKMIEGLCEYCLPLMVWQTQINWDDVDAVCTAFPDLQLIIEGHPQKIMYHNRRFYTLLEKHRNLKLESHNVIGFQSVEEIVKHFGADRLVFGSFLPYWDPDATMMAVTHARISDEAKKKIAHGNLMQLLDSVKVTK